MVSLDKDKFYHFSDRTNPPSYRSVQVYASTPAGVYFYSGDAFSRGAANFGTNRKYVHIAESLVDILDLRDYTQSDLNRDLNKIKSIIGDSQYRLIEKKWNKYRDTFRNNSLPAATLMYFVSKSTTSKDEDDAPTFYSPGTEDPQFANEILKKLGYRAITDHDGLIYPGEDEQTVFLDDSSFKIVNTIKSSELSENRIMKMKVDDLQKIIKEELIKVLAEANGIEVTGADTENDDLPPNKDSSNMVDKKSSDNEKEDNTEVQLGNDPADNNLSQDVANVDDSEDGQGEIEKEILGKTLGSIEVSKSKFFPGAQEVAIKFEQHDKPLRIIITKSGQIKFFFKGSLHNKL